jgi:hypothetical protein
MNPAKTGSRGDRLFDGGGFGLLDGNQQTLDIIEDPYKASKSPGSRRPHFLCFYLHSILYQDSFPPITPRSSHSISIWEQAAVPLD